MTQNQKMRDFVKSLENNQFSKEQEAMLLVKNSTEIYDDMCPSRAFRWNRLTGWNGMMAE